MKRFLVLSGAALLAGCTSTPLGYLEGSGSRPQDIIQSLGIGLLLICSAVVLIIIALIAIAIQRSRGRAATSSPSEIGSDSGGLGFVYWGVALSVPVLIGMAIWTFLAVRAIANPPTTPELVVTVTGHRWWWQITYQSPSQPFGIVTTANELVIPVGVPIRLDLASADVIHDFWVPKLGPKMDMIPGRVNHSWIRADKPGNYRGQCAEFCGAEHGRMGFIVHVLPRDQFVMWLNHQRQPALADGTGRHIFEQKCMACHTVRGTTAAGIYGPDLTHVGSRTTLAAAMMPNTPQKLDYWLGNTQTVKPGSQMPQVDLSSVERAKLTVWMESLK